MTLEYPPYVDLDQAYPRPATGEPSNRGWWDQAAYNLQEMWHALYVQGGPGNNVNYVVDVGYTEDAFPPFIDVTPNGVLGASGYIRVGQICWVYAWGNITAMGSAVGFTLPVPPADTVLTLADCTGSLINASNNQWKGFSGRIVGGELMFYDELGPVDSSSLASIGAITMTACYRIAPPAAEGRLTDRTAKVVEQTL